MAVPEATRVAALADWDSGMAIGAVAKKYGISKGVLSLWRKTRAEGSNLNRGGSNLNRGGKRSGGKEGKTKAKIVKEASTREAKRGIDLSGAPELAAHIRHGAWGLSGFISQAGDVREARFQADVKRAKLRAEGKTEEEINKLVPIPRYPDMMKIAAATRALRGLLVIAPDLGNFDVQTGGARKGEESMEADLASAYGVAPDDLAPPLRVVK